MNKSRMGKGLESLLKKDKNILKDFQEIDIESIEAGSMQTREHFDQKQLEELAETIKSHGVLQPIIVYKQDGKFKIISGERRFRASKIANLKTIPSRVVSWSDEKILNANILENIQRAQLNGIEEANAYKRFMDEYDLTQEEIARKVGKSRSHIANLIRLLKLPKEVQELIYKGSLTIGHGKVLLQKYKEEKELTEAANKIASEGISIQESIGNTSNNREIEQNKNPNVSKHETSNSSNNANSDEYASIADSLSHNLEFDIKIIKNGKEGSLNINFKNDIELDKILDLFASLK
ncbi:ParB/RepB/Spo0J family partition protein [Candidatus Cytomitobacter indipagum]|uniref:ParB/RepB/Spo0J family partition protein n=1 Tax=Candidatus Cytomitobacter indipagum TaxID=2601575 RepID=A0A5C0UE16_9PROT|nr:ParB/RepB/Spo0J family partition protein [Candidatus Cytomitobacter indipagum]QEK38009.1 ParB/RepB/Spo0J family partition protein [Candidatus Cytomitobacter indipagum]